MFDVTTEYPGIGNNQNMGPSMLKAYLNSIDWSNTQILTLKVERSKDTEELEEAAMCAAAS